MLIISLFLLAVVELSGEPDYLPYPAHFYQCQKTTPHCKQVMRLPNEWSNI